MTTHRATPSPGSGVPPHPRDDVQHLCDTHGPDLRRFLLGLLRDHHQADDALQETFVKAIQRLDTVDPDRVRPWLFTVAYHQAMLLKRRARRSAAVCGACPFSAADPMPGPETWVEQQEDAGRLRSLLEQLSPFQREVIRRRVFEGKRFREIAEEMACSVNTTLGRMHDGLRRLRLLWGEQQ